MRANLSFTARYRESPAQGEPLRPEAARRRLVTPVRGHALAASGLREPPTWARVETNHGSAETDVCVPRCPAMQPEASTVRPTLVLVVDDEPLVRMLGADVLEEAGFSVAEAGDAAEALQKLEDCPEVRVLFTDVNMPGALDGLALAHRVHEQRPDICLLIASGQARLGPEDLPDEGQFVEKPWEPRDVVRRIQGMLRVE